MRPLARGTIALGPDGTPRVARDVAVGARGARRGRRGHLLVLRPHPAALPALPTLRPPRRSGLVPLPLLRPAVPPERPAPALSSITGEASLRAGGASTTRL